MHIPAGTKPLTFRLLAHLKRYHTGRRKALPSRALEARFSVCGSTIRRAVLALRRAGEPICSGQDGYYYAADSPELWATIDRVERRLIGTAQIAQGLRKAARQMPDQNQMPLKPAERRMEV